MRKTAMKRQDLLELWQLLGLYQKAYRPVGVESINALMEEISREYKDATHGEEIAMGRNPRNAGRKKQYTEEHGLEIARLHGQGISIRETARQMGCSAGQVQAVLGAQK